MTENMMPTVKAVVGTITWQEQVAYLTAYTDQVVAKYDGLVFTDQQMSEAKKDRATLSNYIKDIDSVRKSVKTKWLAPLSEYENAVNEQTSRIKTVREKIDAQVKEYESNLRQQKKLRIESWWKENGNKSINVEKVFDDRYLNATYKDSQWQHDLAEKKNKIDADLFAIAQMTTPEGKMDWCMTSYLNTMDLGQTLQAWENHLEQMKRIEEIKARQEAEKRERELTAKSESINVPAAAAPVQQEEIYTRCFRVRGTRNQIIALGNYMKQNGISFWKLEDR